VAFIPLLGLVNPGIHFSGSHEPGEYPFFAPFQATASLE